LVGKPVTMKMDCMTIEGSVEGLQEFNRIVVKTNVFVKRYERHRE
jgi:hypothetical protein